MQRCEGWGRGRFQTFHCCAHSLLSLNTLILFHNFNFLRIFSLNAFVRIFFGFRCVLQLLLGTLFTVLLVLFPYDLSTQVSPLPVLLSSRYSRFSSTRLIMGLACGCLGFRVYGTFAMGNIVHSTNLSQL